MIGIKTGHAGGAVAVWTGSGPEVVGQGDTIDALVAQARAFGDDRLSGVVAVPA